LLHISSKQSGYWLLIASLTLAIVAQITNCTTPQPSEQVTSEQMASEQLTVLSFNIRYDNPNDGVDAWPNRSEWVSSIIDSSSASVVGLQEVLEHQLADILSHTNRFAFVGVGRDDGLSAGEFSPVLYDSTTWEIDAWETKWLSSNPSVVGIAGWDAALPRIATVVDFRNVSTGQPLRVINTHFDHRGEIARLESAKLIAQWATQVAGPVVVLGDFNFEDSQPPYAEMVSGQDSEGLLDSAALLGGSSAPTFLGFDATNTSGPRIDYVFCNQALLPVSYETLSPSRDGRFPSDHAPVRVNLKLRED